MDNTKVISMQAKDEITTLAVEKINEELKSFKGGNKEKAVSTYVANTLRGFIEQDNRFASVFYKTKRTLSDCCAEVMKGVGGQIADIEVYRRATKFYFPDSEVKFNMTISVGEEPTTEEIERPATVKQQGKSKDKPVPKKKAEPVKKKAKEKKADFIQLDIFSLL